MTSTTDNLYIYYATITTHRNTWSGKYTASWEIDDEEYASAALFDTPQDAREYAKDRIRCMVALMHDEDVAMQQAWQ